MHNRQPKHLFPYSIFQPVGVKIIKRFPEFFVTKKAPDARTQGAEAIIQAVLGELQGEIACQGRIDQISLTTVGGYDVGVLTVIGDKDMELTFWNEFMTLKCQTERRASFPDLITLLSLETGIPVSSAQAKVGQEVAVLLAPRENLILGRGVLLRETIAEAETAVGKKL